MTAPAARSYDACMGGRGARAVGTGPATGLRATGLRATRVSEALEPVLRFGWLGEVVGCHRSAITIATGRGLVTLATDAAGGLPDGVNVGPALSPANLGVAAGMPVHLAASSVSVGDRLAVDLRGAVRWSPVLRPIAIAGPGLAARTARAVDASRGIRTEPRPASAAAPDVSALAGALRRARSVDTAVAAGLPLIGLGPGLTPAGDDVLIGLAAALTALGDPRAPILAGGWAAVAATRTTPVAAGFHRHAADGAFAERLHDLLVAILAGPVAEIPAAVRAATAWGATSGADTVLGVCLGLTAGAGMERSAHAWSAA